MAEIFKFFKIKATKIFITDEMTGRVDIVWHIFEKTAKVKIEKKKINIEVSKIFNFRNLKKTVLFDFQNLYPNSSQDSWHLWTPAITSRSLRSPGK